jgi:hypothetical protein
MVAIAYGAAFTIQIGLTIGAAGFALICFIIWRTSPMVRVDDHTFCVGSAQIPRQDVSEVRIITRQDADRLLGEDGRFFTAIRGSSPHILMFHVSDPGDPHVGWLVSLRHPEPFALALTQK